MGNDVLDEVVCVGRYKDKAIFLDEDNELAFIPDENEILNGGEFCDSYGTLIPFMALDFAEQEEILKNIVKGVH